MVGTSGGVLESLQAPSETQWVAEVVVEITHQMYTWPKDHTEWLATVDLYQAKEDFRCQISFQKPVRGCTVTLTRESVTTVRVEAKGTARLGQLQGLEIPNSSL